MPSWDDTQPEDFDTYWEQEARNDRDEYDQHVRHVEDEQKERLEEHE